MITVQALPAEIEALQVGSLTYFKATDRYYLPYLDPSGEELYVVVNAPAASGTTVGAPSASVPTPSPAATSGPATQTATAPPSRLDLSVPAGTTVSALMSADISSATAKVGQRFPAFLGSDLVVSGRLIAPKGTRVIGRVTEVAPGTGMGGAPVLALELTDIEIGGQVYAVGTAALRLSAEGKNPTKKIVGGALLGAGIGAAIEGGEGAAVGAAVGAGAGTAAAAAASGNQVAAAAGSTLTFALSRPLTVTVLVA